MSFRDKGNRVQLPFGLAYSDIAEVAPEDDLKYILPINGPMNDIEEEQVNQYLKFESLIRNSSFFTGDSQADSIKSKNDSTISTSNIVQNKKKIENYYEGGINDGLKRYSDKYRKQIKVAKTINDHPLVPSFFPEELQYLIKGSKSTNNSNKNKSLKLSNYQSGEIDDLTNTEKVDELIKLSEAQEKQQQILDRLNNVEENEDDPNNLNNDIEDESEEEDDEFEEDDDDDYNAEKYFDDGDDDFGDNDDGDDEAAF